MAEPVVAPMRVELIADDGEQRDMLRTLLQGHGAEVVAQLTLDAFASRESADIQADVVLIDLVEEPDVTSLENLIASSTVPILFSESAQASARGWGDKLFHKLQALAQRGRDVSAMSPATQAPAEEIPLRPSLTVVGEADAATTDAPQAVWVLGASIGGPEAVKAFTSYLPAELPITLLLAQHIGQGFDQRLAGQLDRVTRLRVARAEDGDMLRAGELLVVPTDGRMEIDADGCVRLTSASWSGPYSPTIDDVMVQVARRYGVHGNAILFSGMGDDGAAGALAIAEAGGSVWAQDEASCVISSIPDAARRKGVVTFNGSPEELAHRLVERCQKHMALES